MNQKLSELVVKHGLKSHFYFFLASVLAFQTGRSIRFQLNCLPASSWRTPIFTGNSGRSPIYPFIAMPFWQDHEETRDYERKRKVLEAELLLAYKHKQFTDFYHPQRETKDFGQIQDAEFKQDLQKLLEEQRHEVALDLVEKGIYKDVVEAKQIQRKYRIQASDYKYKHLLYRD